VVSGSVFLRGAGNAFLDTQELVDVHFSERGRQGRLLVLAMETGRDWAFGVDENTAYVWRLSQEYEVVGENGVVIFQSASGSAASQSALMHYLTAGDRINTATGQVTWAPPKVPCPIAPTPGSSFNIFSSTNYRDVAIGTTFTATQLYRSPSRARRTPCPCAGRRERSWARSPTCVSSSCSARLRARVGRGRRRRRVQARLGTYL
jgi:hypothetical protein